jgi:hypothetical protein
MIKSNELRIGNFVCANIYSTKETPISYVVYEVTGIDSQIITFRFDDGYTGLPINEFNPIPLTEQWLIKFGFKTNDYDLEKGYIKYNKKESNYERMIRIIKDKYKYESSDKKKKE